MKKVFLILGTLLLSLSTYAAMNVNKIDPPFWYTGMQNPELQLMVYGEGIGNAAVSVNYPGVSLSSTVKLGTCGAWRGSISSSCYIVNSD